MKTAAVICEYNPFHNGHAHMLRTLKKEGFDHIVCFMSGNFTQRGEPAVADKYLRAKAALLQGADLVLELPVVFATSSARDFASCGVKMAADTGCTHLAFGIESGTDLTIISEYAEASEKEGIGELLRKGFSYPEAVSAVSGLEKPGPNAILAAEYLRAIRSLPESNLLSFPIPRSGDGYHAETASRTGFASAKSIRNMLLSGDFSSVRNQIPGQEADDLLSSVPVSTDLLSVLLSDRLLREDDFSKYLDVSREISDRLFHRRNLLMSFTERIEDTKTRQYTRSRIARALLHIVLGITRDQSDALKADGWYHYLRVLAYRKDSGLLGEIKKSVRVPVISRTADLMECFPSDFYYDQVYYSLTGAVSEYLRSPFIL